MKTKAKQKKLGPTGPKSIGPIGPKDDRPIKLFGYIGEFCCEQLVAEDRTDCPRKARQIADAWRGSGMNVEIN